MKLYDLGIILLVIGFAVGVLLADDVKHKTCEMQKQCESK